MLKEFVKIPNNIYWPDHFQAWGHRPEGHHER